MYNYTEIGIESLISLVGDLNLFEMISLFVHISHLKRAILVFVFSVVTVLVLHKL